jgi:hypothetical protein
MKPSAAAGFQSASCVSLLILSLEVLKNAMASALRHRAPSEVWYAVSYLLTSSIAVAV